MRMCSIDYCNSPHQAKGFCNKHYLRFWLGKQVYGERITNYSSDLERKVMWRKKRKDKAIQLLGGRCIECGSTDKLEFDHIDPKHCNFRIGSGLTRSWELVRKELLLCQLLCKSCHRRKTNEDNGFNSGNQHGYHSTYVNTKCRCSLCRKANRDYARHRRSLQKQKKGIR